MTWRSHHTDARSRNRAAPASQRSPSDSSIAAMSERRRSESRSTHAAASDRSCRASERAAKTRNRTAKERSMTAVEPKRSRRKNERAAAASANKREGSSRSSRDSSRSSRDSVRSCDDSERSSWNPDRSWCVSMIPALFKAHHLDLVIAGHDHIYERGEWQGLKYLISGGGGAPLYRDVRVAPSTRTIEATFHYVLASVRSDSRRSDGETVGWLDSRALRLRPRGLGLRRFRRRIARDPAHVSFGYASACFAAGSRDPTEAIELRVRGGRLRTALRMSCRLRRAAVGGPRCATT
jgi:hypothetical protein